MSLIRKRYTKVEKLEIVNESLKINIDQRILANFGIVKFNYSSQPKKRRTQFC